MDLKVMCLGNEQRPDTRPERWSLLFTVASSKMILKEGKQRKAEVCQITLELSVVRRSVVTGLTG